MKRFLKRFIISISFFYAFFLIYSSYEFFYLKRYSKAQKIKNNRVQNEDISLKINAIKKGFTQTYYPNHLLKKVIYADTFIYPVGSLPQTETYLCNEGYGLINYKTDRFGLRNKDYKWELAQNNSNIFLLGDSFVQGYCLEEKWNISTVLDKVLKKNTLNLGSAGNGPYEYMAIMKSLVNPILKKSKHENHLVVIFYANDNQFLDRKKKDLIQRIRPIVRLSKNNGYQPTKKYLDWTENLIKKNYFKPKEALIADIESPILSLKRSALYQIGTFVPVRYRLNKFIKRKTLNQITPSQEVIIQLSKICNYKCKPSIAYMPNSKFWYPLDGDKNYKSRLLKTARQFGINFIDLEEVIDKNNIEDYGLKGGHLSISGAEKIANIIARKIKNYERKNY